MNKTEIKGLQYILTNTKYTEKDILFQQKASPDFICSDGHGFEIKSIYVKDIIFHESQWNELKQQKNIDVLAFYHDSDIPIVLPMSTLVEKEIIQGIKVIVYRNKGVNASRTLSLPPQTWATLDQLAKKYGYLSTQELIRRCVDAMFRGETKTT